ncbi:helix-turn-helix transcriptional regulator [Microbispora sp. NEAU-D428]|uniref:winged helix-turn-helix transcriptional regulator n=1 Tax=Microbispora sitophila TaxID=2771537 RepID=UPI001866EDE2|nr:helix-turn-helix domain-containing protein [Microbispora sitophila]MBE3009169.1 helix-turn-helix transcriptional regulator [Microbispora sitophila]
MPTRTGAQKRAQAKGDYDAFLANCPSRRLLDRISDKWVALILAALGSDGPYRPGVDCSGEPRSMRYSELSRRLAGVGQKTLTQTLRSLERDGLLTRAVTPAVPVTVTYELTDLGLSLHHVVRGINVWAEARMDEVLANRGDYDTRLARTPAIIRAAVRRRAGLPGRRQCVVGALSLRLH